ncbi:MAG: sulfite exporter TauE/SafE family protein [Spirochaetia bacterium]|jgi:uncharacterized membrane protein YfcA|nr:sulfite exporter TauE/SafE family protein [Spirochaetia bacterium]
MNFFANSQLTPWQWGLLIFCAIGIGVSKTGIAGVGSIVISVVALVFQARESTGIVLPMICFADILAIIWYRRNVAWKYIGVLLPWALCGFCIALIFDNFISTNSSYDAIFQIMLGVCILICLIVMIWNDYYHAKNAFVPSSRWFGVLFGILGGFTTMIGNTAGPILSIYLLAMRLPKISFVGTAVWFFFIINFLKLPLQYFIWRNIKLEGLLLNLTLSPFIVLGAALGIVIVKKISEHRYRIWVYIMTIVSIGLLFWQVYSQN